MARRINQIREIHSISNDTLENRRKVFERRAAPYKLLADTAIFRREAFDTSFSPFAASSPASIFPLISFVFQRKKKFSPFYSPHRLQEVIDRGFDDPTPREPLRDRSFPLPRRFVCEENQFSVIPVYWHPLPSRDWTVITSVDMRDFSPE